jgi:hypothetical protein
MCIVVDSRITAQRKLYSQSRRGGTSGRQQSRPRDGEWAGLHRGLRAGHGIRGGTRELGRAQRLLVTEAGRAGVPANQEPWRWQGASHYQRTALRDTNQGSRPGIGERASSEATRDGHGAVVAEHSTGERGEVRPKRPTGGKAKPGRARDWEERREGLRAYQPSQQHPGHRRRVAQLCARRPGQPTGYPHR